MMLLVQVLIANTFMGGSSQDLSSFYTKLTKRSSVCSDGIFKAHGPIRFRQDAKNQISPDNSLYTILHNNYTPREIPNSAKVSADAKFLDVDSINSQVYPLTLAGIESKSTKLDLRNNLSGQITLQVNIDQTGTFSIDQGAKLILGKSSDSIENLKNKGLSKSIQYPKLFGSLRYSCTLVNCPELEFLTAIGQLIDCKLKSSEESYEFEPDFAKIKARLLNTYRIFGTESNSEQGIRQRITFRAFELASDNTVREVISKESCQLRFKVKNDPTFMKDIELLKSAALTRFQASGNNPPREFKPDTEPILVYGFGFSVAVQVELKDGRAWII